MVKSLPLRSEVKTEETWNLTDLFTSEEEFQAAVAELEKVVDSFQEQFKGNITDAASVNEALKGYAAIFEKMVPVGTYSSLALSTDQTNDEAQMRSSKFGSTAAKINSKLSFVNSELSELPAETLEQATKDSTEFQNYLEKLIRKKQYQLHPEVEKTLAAFSSTFNAPYGLYNTTKMVDMSFDNFEVDGTSYPNSYVMFEGDWESETDTDVRRAAFDSFYTKLKQYQHTTAKTYDSHLQI
jgi:oligoendopeptidase F